ncbi:Fis family transcriptional regulator [Kocuria flava]|uniref:Fis family transcriptional regulator n=1 Tax=Kocuria flava TaxID=446860 RepID=UPI001F242B0A|nr:Fis family transcriptional regulator [Kocuria flava]
MTWPIPCARCQGHHEIVATWPDGPVCRYCYQAAKRTTGTCACGHTGVLPGRLDGRPTCRDCSGIAVNLDCRTCRAEAELHSNGQCWACVLAATVDRLLADPRTDRIRPALLPVATALKTMTRPNSGLTWLHQPHVTAFLTGLATAPAITHEALDELPASRTREYVRALLLAHGALPIRDELVVRYDDWATAALARVTTGDHRKVLRRFIRWHHQRRLQAMTPVPYGTFLSAKQSTTVAIDFLNWLTTHGIQMPGLQQAHLDQWQTEGPTTRQTAHGFLNWAITSQLVDPTLTMTPHRRGTSPRLNLTDQHRALHRVTVSGDLPARDRAAAILVLVFGQQIKDVVKLTWQDVTVTDELVTLVLGADPIALPAPLDEPWRALAAAPGHDATAAHPNSPWVFRSSLPGQHLSAGHLRHRLSTHFSARAARLGTLHELTKHAPVAIIADTLGYAPATIAHHATASSAGYAQYVAAIRATQKGEPTP